jgi:DNA-binding NtrC family response regulator
MRVGSTRETTVDVRVVAATHRRLDGMTDAGQFRQDLLFRLAAARLEIPPLRERPRDIVVLARAFLGAARARLGRPPMAMAPAAMHALATHPWPGNVRELRNAVDFAAVTSADDARLERWHLPPLGAPAPAAEPGAAPSPLLPLFPNRADTEARGKSFRPIADEIRDLEKARMMEALDAAAGNQTRAAAMIAMPLRTFVTKMKAYDLKR